jgi:hypothetical protein
VKSICSSGAMTNGEGSLDCPWISNPNGIVGHPILGGCRVLGASGFVPGVAFVGDRLGWTCCPPASEFTGVPSSKSGITARTICSMAAMVVGICSDDDPPGGRLVFGSRDRRHLKPVRIQGRCERAVLLSCIISKAIT